ncbi:MAG: hypothetical protein NWE93_09185 [Candidatus Bathyarchaeota archaeon]|nr:hypothetical protein [Candidatus Bathyarchaeota archaeon]
MYLPLNVAYGTSVNNCVWFQMSVQFNDDDSITWAIFDIRGPGDSPDDFEYYNIPIDYVPGHSYSFSIAPNGGTITFSITDTTTQTPWAISTWHFDIPSLNMLYNTNCFSPASAIEGVTSSGQLTNVPYFETYMGYGQTTFWEWASGSRPLGIAARTWPGSTNYYHWEMLRQHYVSNYLSPPTTWGQGAVNNPSGLVGDYNDRSYVQLWGGNYGDGGLIIGQMADTSTGGINLWGYSGTGYYSHVYVFVSYNNYYDWDQVVCLTVYGDGTGPHWIYCGSWWNDFRYIAIVAIDDNGMSANFFVDSVQVTAA